MRRLTEVPREVAGRLRTTAEDPSLPEATRNQAAHHLRELERAARLDQPIEKLVSDTNRWLDEVRAFAIRVTAGPSTGVIRDRHANPGATVGRTRFALDQQLGTHSELHMVGQNRSSMGFSRVDILELMSVAREGESAFSPVSVLLGLRAAGTEASGARSVLENIPGSDGTEKDQLGALSRALSILERLDEPLARASVRDSKRTWTLTDKGARVAAAILAHARATGVSFGIGHGTHAADVLRALVM